MKFLKRYYTFIISLVFCFLPVIMLCLPGVRSYVFETWHEAAFYSSTIIILYLTGVFISIFSFIEIYKCVAVLRKKNAQKHSYLLGDANQIVFSNSHGLDDDTVATLYESMDNSVNRKQNQSLGGVMTCANLSTMIGLLGTFAGLSMTIASVITLLDKSQMTGGNEADTLGIIVGVVSSLSEPLKGMNTAFVASIYGVVSAILLNVVNSFLRSEFSRLSIDLRNARLDFVRESHQRLASKVGKNKTLRLITDLDDVIKEFKTGMFEFQERLSVSFDSSNGLLNALLSCVTDRNQRSELFNQQLITNVQHQNEQLHQIVRHITQSYSTLTDIEREAGVCAQAIVSQGAQFNQLSEQQSLMRSNQQQLLVSMEAHGSTLDEMAVAQTEILHSANEIVESIVHAEASIGELRTSHEQHIKDQSSLMTGLTQAIDEADSANLKRHLDTAATLESQSQTFEPLLGQIAGMHRHLQKEINVIKGIKNDE